MWTSECGPCSSYCTLIFVQALNVISLWLLSEFVDSSVEEQVCAGSSGTLSQAHTHVHTHTRALQETLPRTLNHPTAQMHIHAGARRRTQRDPPAYIHTHILPYLATARPGGCAVVPYVDRRELCGNYTAVVALHLFHEQLGACRNTRLTVHVLSRALLAFRLSRRMPCIQRSRKDSVCGAERLNHLDRVDDEHATNTHRYPH